MADRRTWTAKETSDFITVAKELKLVAVSDSTRKRNIDHFRAAQQELEMRGHHFSLSQLRRKWKSLKESYHKIRKNLSTSGQSSKGSNWSYFEPMHEIFASRPRSSAMQPGFGLESGKEKLPQTMYQHVVDTEPNMLDKENAPPIITAPEESSSVPNDGLSGSADSLVEAASENAQSSTPLRTVRGGARRSARRRATAPYEQADGLHSILQFLRESEERHLELEAANRECMNAMMQTLNNVANAFLLSLSRDSSNSQ